MRSSGEFTRLANRTLHLGRSRNVRHDEKKKIAPRGGRLLLALALLATACLADADDGKPAVPSVPLDRHDIRAVRAGAHSIDMIRPFLHQPAALDDVQTTVVCRSDFVPRPM